ncbi:hypothetical protein H4R18_002398 [Coemansia javaensis]|uniref:Rrn7/TAF1B C-terminal cyclin domain-containing protein n=1 Tax=Coemansia javaensis TaxID=2761396 RepID=A0A9W8H9U1_9FUNG|nr:hypothetical protein H4R18_002398 [Coemansia javaensis]
MSWFAGSGGMQGSRPRCAVCGTKRMARRDDGRLMCKRGHEQAGVVEEEAEGIVEGSTRRHVKTARRESKRQQRQGRRAYGREAQFLVVQGMQHILKAQATMLVQNEGAPEALLEAARRLWLLYASTLDIVRLHGEEGAEQTGATGTQSAAQTQRRSGGGGYGVDGSLDFLLAKVDADIARDKIEMLELGLHHDDDDYDDGGQADAPMGGQGSDGAGGGGGATSDWDTDQPAGGRGDKGRRGPQARARERALLSQIEAFPRMEYLPALLLLAFAWLQLPVSCADLHYLMADERVPYVSARHYVPPEIYTRIGDGVLSVFIVPYPPGAERLQHVATAFGQFFAKHHALALPPTNVPLALLSIVRRLGLSPGVYPMAMRLLEALGRQGGRAHRSWQHAHMQLTAAVVVCLKLHYGLDEVERVPLDGAPELDMPPLRAFLDRWRREWLAELRIGAAPFLTAFSDRWEAAFAAYYGRATHRPYGHIADFRAVFRELGPKYRQIVDALAADERVDAETARRLLPPPPPPPEHARPDAARGGKARDAVAAQIDPLRMAAGPLSAAAQREFERPYSSAVEPLDEQPGIRLQRGEQYFALIMRASQDGFPGYMIPTLGLVVARCAMMLGCTQTALLQCIAGTETQLAAAMKKGRL